MFVQVWLVTRGQTVLRAARQGNEQARALLAERARVLGEAVALLRDMLNPDDLVVRVSQSLKPKA